MVTGFPRKIVLEGTKTDTGPLSPSSKLESSVMLKSTNKLLVILATVLY